MTWRLGPKVGRPAAVARLTTEVEFTQKWLREIIPAHSDPKQKGKTRCTHARTNTVMDITPTLVGSWPHFLFRFSWTFIFFKCHPSFDSCMIQNMHLEFGMCWCHLECIAYDGHSVYSHLSCRLECVASVVHLPHDFVHPSFNNKEGRLNLSSESRPKVCDENYGEFHMMTNDFISFKRKPQNDSFTNLDNSSIRN